MVKLDDVPKLTDEEVEFIQSSLDTVSSPDNRKAILLGILEECPELEEAFKMVVGVDRQSSFLINMMKRGFNYVCYQSYDTVYDIFVRHPKYGITLDHLNCGYKHIVSTISKVNNDEASTNAWQKCCDILAILADKAYNRPDEKVLNKNRKRVMRSMSADDIQCVQDTWASVVENEIGVAELLAQNLSRDKKIVKKFHEHNIDVFKQSVIILRMLTKTLAQLDDVDMIVPFLKKLGHKHVEMGVGVRLLASMKPIIFETLEKCLGFGFTDELKTSWNKVLAFIIGMMVEASRDHGQTTRISADNDSIASNYADGSLITQKVVDITQQTWRAVDKVIDRAVESFYKDLLTNSSIRNLFSKSDMQSQAQKLLRAIGSTVALLDNPETLIPILEELGRRHVYYNVRPKYFKWLKKAWFNMLKRALALKWTAEVEESWNIAWSFVANVMKSSLEDALLLYIPPEPEKVKLKVLIHHIDRVKANDLSFYADIWYAAYTGDNPSQSAAFGASHAQSDADSTFYDDNNNPTELAPFGGLRCLNAMDTKEIYRERKEKWLRKFPGDDTWYMRGQIRGTFAQQFNLHAFPFDQHKLLLTFALDIDDGIALFDETSLFVRLMPFKMESMAGADWDVYEPDIKIIQQSATSGGSSSGKRYTHAQVSIPISRKWTHHIYETILPLLLIEIVAWGVYFAEEFPMVERLAVVVTLLLTLFAFKWTVSKSLPPTPYLTLMDHFFNAAYLLLFLHISGLAIITLVHHTHAHWYNWLICGTNALIFGLIHSFLFYKMNHYSSLYPKKNNISALEAVARAALKSPSKKGSTNFNASQLSHMSGDKKDKKDKKGKKANKYQVQPITHEA